MMQDHRFRYPSPNGGEIPVRDLEELEEHIADGRVSAKTPLFDARTGVLAPAADHDLWHDLQEPQGRSSPVESPDEPPETPDVGGALPDLGVSLADVEPLETSEEAMEALRKEREIEERMGDVPRVQVDRHHPSLVEWHEEEDPLPVGKEEDAGGDTVEDTYGPRGTHRPAGEESAGELHVSGIRDTAGDPAVEEREGDGGARGPAADGPRYHPSAAPTTPTSRTAAPTRRGPGMSGWVGSRLAAGALRVALVASVLIAGTWLALDSTAVEPGGDVAGGVGGGWTGPEPAAGPTDPGRAATRLASTQDAAFVHMVQGVDSLARHFDVTRVPSVWLDARYLADAARYDEVGAYWERYLAFVREARTEDRALFRQGFVARLHELGVSPTVISMRLAQAARNFDESMPRRDSLYSRMEELAVAALDLHALLEERSADLHYDPIQADRAPRDPFLQIATEDSDLRESIWRNLDRVFDGLEALHGSAPWSRGDPTDAALERLRSQGVGSP